MIMDVHIIQKTSMNGTSAMARNRTCLACGTLHAPRLPESGDVGDGRGALWEHGRAAPSASDRFRSGFSRAESETGEALPMITTEEQRRKLMLANILLEDLTAKQIFVRIEHGQLILRGTGAEDFNRRREIESVRHVVGYFAVEIVVALWTAIEIALALSR